MRNDADGDGGATPRAASVTPAWLDAFPGLAVLPAEVRGRLGRAGRVVEVPQGAVVFEPGGRPGALILLIEGTVRVSQTSESGREIVLYRVEAGESCVLTTACLLAHETLVAEGVAETPVRAAVLPAAAFDALMAEPSFRELVLRAYAQRIVDLFHVVEEVAFGRIDVRLAQRLVRLAAGRDEVRVTHQDLATELGTAREVISRQLNDFHRKGWIRQTRGRIEIVERVRLAQIAGA